MKINGMCDKCRLKNIDKQFQLVYTIPINDNQNQLNSYNIK